MGRHGYRALLLAGGIGVAASVILAFALPHELGSTVAHTWVWGVVVPTYLVGAFAAALCPDHLSARWLGVAGSLMAIETVARRLMPLVDDVAAGWWVVGSIVTQVAVLATTASIASVLVVFPDDEYRYPYQRRVLWGVWLAAAAIPPTLLFGGASLFFAPSWFRPDVTNPLFLSVLSPLAAVAEAAFDWRVALWAAGAAAMVVRYGRATPRERQQFMWPLGAALLLTIFDIVYRLLHQAEVVPQNLVFVGWVPGFALLSASILIALLRHRLIGVDLWLRRSILFGGASAFIALAYLGLAGLLGLAAGQRASLGIGVLVTLAAVVAFEPVRHRLDEWARVWVFGRSAAGSEVLRRVGDTLEDAYDVEQLGFNLVRTIIGGLELEWARLSLAADGETRSYPIAALGIGDEDSAAPDLVVPLTYFGETVGFLECGPKREGELSQADEELVTTVARQAALAVRNVRLASELASRLDELRRQADELAASRSRIVHAQMKERRRIERNIHDGVQQEIIALIAKIRLARNQLARDPQLAETTLAGGQGDARITLENLRELSRGIHPPVLAHRGLTDALRTQASLLPIDVEIDVAPEVSRTRFSDEVEEAAYYVISEGLTNVLKHAATEQATVKLATNGESLTVQVIDHGQGCDTNRPPGSGIVGLRDRLGSIGGELQLDSQPGDGTILWAVFPLRAVDHA
jgi:signal transduction histidine kinase